MSGKNANGGDMPGKVGNVRTFVRNGKVYTRVTTNMRLKSAREMMPTRELMRSRLLQNWVTKMWLVVKEASRGLWEEKRPGATDMNSFLSVNRQSGRGVFLCKDDVKVVQVAAPLQISQGSLCAIAHEEDGEGRFVTNIPLGSLNLTPETTVHQFTCALMGESDWEEGDRLSLVIVEQGETGGLPHCRTKTYGVTLQRDNDLRVAAFFPEAFWGQKDGFLATGSSLPSCCFTFLHTRQLTSGKVLCSTQVLQNCNRALVEQYLSEEQFGRAAESYGGIKESFL